MVNGQMAAGRRRTRKIENPAFFFREHCTVQVIISQKFPKIYIIPPPPAPQILPVSSSELRGFAAGKRRVEDR